MIIISQTGGFWKAWMVFITIVSFLSSYFYGFIAAFMFPVPGDKTYIMHIIFELIFVINISLKFLVDFIPEG